MRDLRLREVNGLAQGHPAPEWYRRLLESGLFGTKNCVLLAAPTAFLPQREFSLRAGWSVPG